ncbi:carboxypeptidase-like regulatory domain-containing protein [Prevotella jejuni]
MVKGKSTCKLLKSIRQQIANANGISYQPKECHYEGDCVGTCPACEAEIRYLETQLRERKRKGWGIKVAGLAAGICIATVPLTSCQNTPKACNVENKAQDSTDMLVQGETEVMPEARTRDLKCSIAISGRVLNASSGEAASEVNIIIQGGKKRVSLGEDGRFALQVNRNDTLVFSSYGYIDKMIAVKSIRNPNDMVVRLEPSLDKVGEIDREYLEKELENSAAPQSHQEKCSQN